MSNSIDISIASGSSGHILFDEAPRQLDAILGATGLNIIIPYTIAFRGLDQNELNSKFFPVLSHIRATIFTGWDSRNVVEIGFAHDYFRHVGAKGAKNITGQLIWSCSSQSLFRFEEIRNGDVPEFRIDLWAEAYYQVPSIDARLPLLTEPRLITGQVKIRYPREVWIAMLERIGAGLHILVEVPLPAARPAPWDGVWKSLKDARDAFDQGGTTGWQNCVANLRQALDNWRNIPGEEEELGSRTPPDRTQRENRTKKERLDLVRWHLRELTHLAHHGHSDQWSRDDALFILSVLSGLLAIRKP